MLKKEGRKIMELYITDLGTMIKKRDDLFEITTSEKKVAVAPQKIKSCWRREFF